jgi:hypothetical protein
MSGSSPRSVTTDSIERKIVQSYIISNTYWPQSRASFVLCALSSLNYSEALSLVENDGTVLNSSSIEKVMEIANRIHERSRVWTVLPTSFAAVQKEFRQSCKVLSRVIIELTRNRLQLADDWGLLNLAAKEIWHELRDSPLLENQRQVIFGPQSRPAEARRLSPKENPLVQDIFCRITEKFSSDPHAALIRTLEPEILHTITVVRPSPSH